MAQESESVRRSTRESVMTAVLDRPTTAAPRLNRVLLGVAATMAATAVVTAVLAVVDPVQIVGRNGWLKPLKFAISIGIYALTIAWLLTLLPARRQRLGRGIAWVIAIAMAVEMAAIVGAVAVGTTSHFNVSTPFHAAVWASMGTAIAAVWLVTVLLAVLLWRSVDDPARRLAIRAGLVIGLAGMAVAFLMTSPTPEQLDSFSGIAGAHAVGVPDDGPGLPLLGWSTTGGDLRVPHFVGMHACRRCRCSPSAWRRCAGGCPRWPRRAPGSASSPWRRWATPGWSGS